VTQEPTTLFGLIAAVVVTVPSTVAAVAAFRVSRRNRDKIGEAQTSIGEAKTSISDVQTTVNTVNQQVTNNHKTNLRDDLSESLRHTDGLRAQLTESVRLMGIIKTGMERLQDEDIRMIRADQTNIREDIQVLRHELTDERDARTELDERVREHHRQHPPPPETGE
jgi:peptidoglycan hydrolase CwlO-like protein